MESQAIPPGRERSLRAAWRNLSAASPSAATAGWNWGSAARVVPRRPGAGLVEPLPAQHRSACYAVVVVAAVLLIARSDLASPAAGFLALAVAAAVSLLVYVPQIRFGGHGGHQADPGPPRPPHRRRRRAPRAPRAAARELGPRPPDARRRGRSLLGPGLYVAVFAALVGLRMPIAPPPVARPAPERLLRLLTSPPGLSRAGHERGGELDSGR